MPKVSVIIPTWNRAGTVEKCVLSVLEQTVTSLEVLVCDDGSSDNTREIIQSIKDPRLKWIEGARSGHPAVPRNRGIRLSSGEWLAFLDSDDEWVPDKLEKQLALAEDLNCRAISSNANRFIPGSGIRGLLLEWQEPKISFAGLLQGNQVICSSAVIHRSLLEQIGFFPEALQARGVEDYAFWLRAAVQTDFAYVNEPLVIYRDEAAMSVRGTVTTNLWKQRKSAFGDFLAWAASHKGSIPELESLLPAVRVEKRKAALRAGVLLKAYMAVKRFTSIESQG